MSDGCEEYERLEKILIVVRKQYWFMGQDGKLSDEKMDQLIREELKALHNLLDHAAEHGCPH